MYFVVPADFKVEGGSGIIISSIGHKGLFQLGEPFEEKGRLKYIDGCSDTLSISPLKKGEPCFNHLHFPRIVSQTMHRHPSDRIGIIARGNGVCKTAKKSGRISGVVFGGSAAWIFYMIARAIANRRRRQT